MKIVIIRISLKNLISGKKESDKEVKGKYCVNINAKIRYINPLVNGKRISEISEIAKEEIKKALEYKTYKYAYLDFDNF